MNQCLLSLTNTRARPWGEQSGDPASLAAQGYPADPGESPPSGFHCGERKGTNVKLTLGSITGKRQHPEPWRAPQAPVVARSTAEVVVVRLGLAIATEMKTSNTVRSTEG